MTYMKMFSKLVASYRQCFAVGSLLLVSLNASAQSVADLWISMPDDIVPYLTVNQKKEMIECDRIGVDSSVKNKLEGNTAIDTLSESYGKFLVSNSRSLQLVKLPTDNDSILMVIDTHLGPKAHSEASFYTLNWDKLSEEGRIPEFALSDFAVRPDTMSVEDYDCLISSVVPLFFQYDYDKTTETLIVSPQMAIITLDEKKRFEGLVSKQKLIWGNKMFIKVII